eukprot:SAG11_NODE_572_length_8445_cov_7.136353_1_plen_82_part_00
MVAQRGRDDPLESSSQEKQSANAMRHQAGLSLALPHPLAAATTRKRVRAKHCIVGSNMFSTFISIHDSVHVLAARMPPDQI